MISVCVATYNGENYIKEQIDSILCQLSKEDEIIISDDGSTDSTLEILKSYKDSRIKILRHKHNTSYTHSADYTTHNFENALLHAKGEYIFLSDQDDVWLPNKVEVMKTKLLDYGLVVSDCMVVDSQLSVIHPSYFAIHRTKKGVINNLYINAFHGACMAFRKEVLNQAIPFPNSDVGHDFWLGLIATHYYSVEFINQPLILYRRHDNTVSPSAKGSTLPISYRIQYRLITIFELCRRILLKNYSIID